MPTDVISTGERATKKRTRVGRPSLTDKEKLLDVSERLFADKGYNGVSLREVASLAHCNVALISYHFGGKKKLYQALLLRHFQRTRKSAGVPVKDLNTPFDDPWKNRVHAILYECGRVILANTRMHKILCREMLAGGRHAGEGLKAAAECGFFGVFHEELQRLIKNNKLRPDLDVPLAVISLLGPLVYSCIAHPMLKTVYSLESLTDGYLADLVDHLSRTFFEGNSL